MRLDVVWTTPLAPAPPTGDAFSARGPNGCQKALPLDRVDYLWNGGTLGAK